MVRVHPRVHVRACTLPSVPDEQVCVDRLRSHARASMRAQVRVSVCIHARLHRRRDLKNVGLVRRLSKVVYMWCKVRQRGFVGCGQP